MAQTTAIAWTDHTHNSHWGCQEVSPGCDNCYARTLSERWHRAQWGDPKNTLRMVTSDANWRKPRVWNARVAARDTNWTDDWKPPVRPGTLRRLVFSNSMSDLFEHTAQLDPVRDRMWELIEETPYLDWLLLTKRPQNIRRMIPAEWLHHPRPNVWLGTSAESDEWLERRAWHLLSVPAVVHFISAEPLVGPLPSLHRYLNGIQWVITGGESGAHHRPLDIGWVREVDQMCKAASAAHFFKQHGGRTHAEGGCLLDGIEVKEFPRTTAPEPVRRAA
jgi:protein gp37